MEHEHEAAAPAPAAPVVAAPAAAGAGPPLTSALTPARVLALQRTIGNRATGAILARAPAAGAGDFGVSGGVPVSSGSVIASKEGADKVNVKAPLVTLDGAAWLKKDRELGTSAYIGVVQNLVSSVRGAVYRHGGDPTGEIVAEHVTGQANKRDAVSDPNNNAQPQTFAPFYWQPGNIDDSNVEGTPAKSSRLGTPSDQPEFDMPVTSGPAGSRPSRATTPSRWASRSRRKRRSGCSPARRGRWTGTSRSTRTSAAPARRSRPRRSRTCSRTARTSASRPGRWTRTR